MVTCFKIVTYSSIIHVLCGVLSQHHNTTNCILNYICCVVSYYQTTTQRNVMHVLCGVLLQQRNITNCWYCVVSCYNNVTLTVESLPVLPTVPQLIEDGHAILTGGFTMDTHIMLILLIFYCSTLLHCRQHCTILSCVNGTGYHGDWI